MFCMECGTRLPDNAKFCFNCGTKTCADDANPQVTSGNMKKQTELKKTKGDQFR